eukprot:TRINITY_DN75384_c0_g1_i1.p1 TRINITY_DN75384_c0_g1~~TRINITY_DN75384_c0_g1_i1.p1  ORF type:complete len:438 (-),score=124.53 TRINITY_DN75384_c0_g1_i1:224-1537(-)
MAPDSSDGGGRPALMNLRVSGCRDTMISELINGTYTPAGANHKMPIYKKDVKVRGHDILLYYWDDRDGEEECGWWFAPSVGGDQVWAHHPGVSSSAVPPSSGWHAPHDGPIDRSLSVKTIADDSSKKRPRTGDGITGEAARIRKQAREEEATHKEEERKRREREQEKTRKREAKRKFLEEQKKKEDAKLSEEAAKKKLEEEKLRKEAERLQKLEQAKIDAAAREKARREAAIQAEIAAQRNKEYQLKDEEERRKRAEEEKAAREEKASVAVHKALQKLSHPTLENFSDLRRELAEVMAKQLPETGAQREFLTAEADRVLAYAEKHIERIRQHENREELEATAKRLLEELAKLLTAAESAVARLTADAADAKPSRDAVAACSACEKFLATKRPAIEEAATIRSKTEPVLADAAKRLKAATDTANEALRKVAALDEDDV